MTASCPNQRKPRALLAPDRQHGPRGGHPWLGRTPVRLAYRRVCASLSIGVASPRWPPSASTTPRTSRSSSPTTPRRFVAALPVQPLDTSETARHDQGCARGGRAQRRCTAIARPRDVQRPRRHRRRACPVRSARLPMRPQRRGPLTLSSGRGSRGRSATTAARTSPHRGQTPAELSAVSAMTKQDGSLTRAAPVSPRTYTRTATGTACRCRRTSRARGDSFTRTRTSVWARAAKGLVASAICVRASRPGIMTHPRVTKRTTPVTFSSNAGMR